MILKVHIKNKHSNEKKHKCTKCNYCSNFKNSIIIHLEGFHGTKRNEVSFSKSANSSIPPPKEDEEDNEEEEEDEELHKSRLRHLKTKSRNGTPGKALKLPKSKLVTLEELEEHKQEEHTHEETKTSPGPSDPETLLQVEEVRTQDWICEVCELTFPNKPEISNITKIIRDMNF